MVSQPPASYATPKAIIDSLPANQKDGIPSLPYLVDQPLEYAILVKMWVHSWNKQQTTKNLRIEGIMAHFHQLCLHVTDRGRDLVGRTDFQDSSTCDDASTSAIVTESSPTRRSPLRRPRSKDRSAPASMTDDDGGFKIAAFSGFLGGMKKVVKRSEDRDK